MGNKLISTEVEELQNKAEVWHKAEQNTKAVIYDLMAAAFYFHANNTPTSIKSYLDEHNIPLVGGKANDFTAVCKLAMAKFYNGDEHLKKLGDANVSKWASAMCQLKAKGVSPETVRERLEGTSINKLVAEYRKSLPTSSGDDEQFEQAKGKLLKLRGTLFDTGGDFVFRVDRVAAGIKPGLHNLIVDVDMSGNVEVLGFSKDDEDEVKQDIKRIFAIRGKHPYSYLADILKLAGAVPHGVTKNNEAGTRLVVLENSEDGLTVSAATRDTHDTVIATWNAPEQDANLPAGISVFNVTRANAFKQTLSKFKSAVWSLDEYKGKKCIAVTADKDIDAVVADINEKAKASWQTAKDAAEEAEAKGKEAKKVSETPPVWSIPVGVKVLKNTIYIPLSNEQDLEGISLATINSKTTWDGTIPLDEKSCAWMVEALRDDKVKGQHCRLKISPQSMEFVDKNGGSLMKYEFGPTLPDDTNALYPLFTQDLLSGLLSIKGLAGKGGCIMQFTTEMLRLNVNNNGIKGDVYIPTASIDGHSTLNQQFTKAA